MMDRHPSRASTYRVQLNAAFTFNDALALVPYLDDLGIGALYTSPFLRAAPGSTHGYDVTDYASLNPEIGSDDDLARLADALRKRGGCEHRHRGGEHDRAAGQLGHCAILSPTTARDAAGL